MYCGCNKTALASQKEIAEAMISLLSRFPYSQISITRICQAAGVSRQTFYTLFQSKENVIYYILKEYGSCLCVTGTDYEDPQYLCRLYSSYIFTHRDLLKQLVDNNISYLLYDSVSDSLKQCGCMERLDPVSRSYTADFLAGGITGFVRNYAEKGCSDTEEELFRILNDLFTGRIL